MVPYIPEFNNIDKDKMNNNFNNMNYPYYPSYMMQNLQNMNNAQEYPFAQTPFGFPMMNMMDNKK
jgi:hypothetical protein